MPDAIYNYQMWYLDWRHAHPAIWWGVAFGLIAFCIVIGRWSR